MPTVHHPAFHDITRDITDDQLADHLAAGWVEQKPQQAAEDKSAEPSTKNPRRQR